MALILSRRSGGKVYFYHGDEKTPFGSVTPHFDSRYPGQCQLHIEMPKDVTILREEVVHGEKTKNRREDAAKLPPQEDANEWR